MQARLGRSKAVRAASSPRLVAASLLALVLSVSGAGADAALKPAPAALVVADAHFGSPPSGEFPILYNDHTVYAKPDILRRSRVLAALVRGGQIYVPLRSMFEQMGATVSVSADGKTVTASKSDASVTVTLGKPEVVVNGESRPLNVPPVLYKGIVLVPVRVISEALGAYVLWVHDRRLVVVRYIPPPAPSPAAPPTAEPTVAPPPPPSPAAVPTQRAYRGYVQAAIAEPRTYNEFSDGRWCSDSYLVSAAYAFKDSRFALKADYRQNVYVTSDNLTDPAGNHYTQFATIDGGVAVTPVFKARQTTLDARLEYQIANPRIYVGVSYLYAGNDYGYPQLSTAGVGFEKLLDLRPGVNFFGSAFYYPTASGNYTVRNPASPNAGATYVQKFGIVQFDVGLALVLEHSPVYLYGGFDGDRYSAQQNAPISQTHDGPYLGLGVKF
jgi:hypothetical protein